MTVSYNLNAINPTNTYPEQLERLLEAETGTAWTIPDPETSAIGEIASAVARINQLATISFIQLIDDWQQHRIAVCWAGTNDLAYESFRPAVTFTAVAGTDIVTATAHGLQTGMCVRVSNSGGALPGNLAAATDYAVIVIDANTLYLATNWTNAMAGTEIDITDAGTGTHTLTPTTSAAFALVGSAALAQTWLDAKASDVYYLNMLPRTDLGAGNAAFAAARTTYNAGLAAALPAGVTLINVAGIPELADSTDLSYYIDGVHLTLAGYTLIAQKVFEAIEPNL